MTFSSCLSRCYLAAVINEGKRMIFEKEKKGSAKQVCSKSSPYQFFLRKQLVKVLSHPGLD